MPSDPEALIVHLSFEIQNVNGESPFDFFFYTYVIPHASGGCYEFHFLRYLRARGKGVGRLGFGLAL